MKKAFGIFLLLILFWGCVSYHLPPPSLYIGSLPSSIVAELSLDERILIEEAWNNLKQGKGNKAKKIILRLGAENPFYNVGLGYANYILNRLKAAEDSFKKALADYPDMLLIHAGLSQIYIKTKREDRAFNEYREILKRKPDQPWARQQYEVLQKRKTNEALIEAKTALDETDIKKSEEAFLKALYYSPQSVEAHIALAEIYKKENKPQNALVHLKAASSNEPRNKEILKNYAETLYQASKNAESLKIYEKLLDLEPENEKILEQIKNLKNKLGIYELPSQYYSIDSSEAVSREEMAALLSIKFKGVVDEASAKPPIIVDIETSWASKFILQMTALNILDVYPNYTFQPKKIVTRAEMAEILLRSITYLEKKGFKFIQQIPPDKISISDVFPENYYFRLIIQILSFNIMDLTPDRAFKPDLPVSGKDATKYLDIILALIR